VHWLKTYDRRFIRPDVIAGVTLAAYVLPAAIADASLAGLPPEAGLYACLFGGLIFWTFCSSRHTAITVTSAISLLVGTSIGELAGGDASRFAALAMGAALLVGLFGVFTWLINGGAASTSCRRRLIDLVDRVVLASADSLSSAGSRGRADSGRMAHRGPSETDLLALALGVFALAVLLAGKRWLPGRPVALVVVGLGIAATSVFDLGARGVKTLGVVPQGLPPLGLPAVGLTDLDSLVPIALACFLLAAVETAAIGRMFALKHGYRFDPNRELLAIGVSNLASGGGTDSRERRYVPISRERIAGARTPAVGPGGRPDHPDCHGRVLRSAARSAATGAGGDRAGGHRRPGEHQSHRAIVAIQPDGVCDCRGGVRRRAGPGHSARRAARRRAVAHHPAPARVAAARR
jgi:hypothetical protein